MDKVHNRHDHAFKKLFTHPEMVRDLIRGFIKEDWAQHLDFDSLEKENASYITKKLKHRSDDVVWRIHAKGNKDEWLYIYFLIEFQSSPDKWMSARLMSYIGLLYLEIIDTKQVGPSGYLPPVVPFVFYTGDSRWKIAKDSGALLSPAMPKKLWDYFPKFQYELLDVGQFSLGEHAPSDSDNLIVPIIQLEQDIDSPPALLAHLSRLSKRLASPKYDSLRRSFVIYFYQSLNLPKALPEVSFSKLNLEGENTMVQERMRKFWENVRQESRLEGEQQGERRGERRGEQKMIIKMLREGVDEPFILKVSNFSAEQLAALKQSCDLIDKKDIAPIETE